MGSIAGFAGNSCGVRAITPKTHKHRLEQRGHQRGDYREDYCLRPISEGGVNATPLNSSMTAAGAKVFSELKASAQIPITYSYVYQNSIAAGCNATALLTTGGSVLGVLSPSTDGRERLALTFTTNQYLLQANLLTYSLMRWASKGVFLGERKHYIHIDVDDWFNDADERNPDGTFVPGGYRMSPTDAFSTYQIQQSMLTKYPSVLPSFMLNIAYNAGDANLTAPANGTRQPRPLHQYHPLSRQRLPLYQPHPDPPQDAELSGKPGLPNHHRRPNPHRNPPEHHQRQHPGAQHHQPDSAENRGVFGAGRI